MDYRNVRLQQVGVEATGRCSSRSALLRFMRFGELTRRLRLLATCSSEKAGRESQRTASHCTASVSVGTHRCMFLYARVQVRYKHTWPVQAPLTRMPPISSFLFFYAERAKDEVDSVSLVLGRVRQKVMQLFCPCTTEARRSFHYKSRALK